MRKRTKGRAGVEAGGAEREDERSTPRSRRATYPAAVRLVQLVRLLARFPGGVPVHVVESALGISARTRLRYQAALRNVLGDAVSIADGGLALDAGWNMMRFDDAPARYVRAALGGRR